MPPSARTAAALAAAEAAVERVGLGARADAIAAGLTTKELRLMEFARALAGRPRLLLMDEPLAGLGGGEIEDLLRVIRALAGEGVTVVVIEHTMQAMVRLADRLVVLDHGRLIAAGLPDDRHPRRAGHRSLSRQKVDGARCSKLTG